MCQNFARAARDSDVLARQVGKIAGCGQIDRDQRFKSVWERLSTARKLKCGGNRNPDVAATTKKVVAKYKRNRNLFIRDVAIKLKVSHITVQRAKKRAGLTTVKKVKVANRDYKQNTSAKQWSRKLYTNMLTKFDCVVMDDETYVKADFKQLPRQEFYTASGKGKVSEIFKTIKLSKFPKKYLVWQAICRCGLKSGILITNYQPRDLRPEVPGKAAATIPEET